jgi:Predicted tRNA(5-methylaminomethyl-2-thiouridylate) methyltransferase, contains the PP-loop ATPase domain
LTCSYPELIRSVTPGQEAVIYDHDVVICGGKIETVYRKGNNLLESIQREADGQ